MPESGRGPRWAVLTASVLGLGFSPVMPGTVGSLAGLALWLPALLLPPHLRLVGPLAGLALSLALGVLALPPVIAATGKEDPQFVVLDEVAGMAVALCLAPPGWPWALLAFALFRVFDITKPFPIGRLEKLPGAWGVMADDVAAGLVAGALTWAAQWGLR